MYFPQQSQKRFLSSCNPFFLLLLIFGFISMRSTADPLFRGLFRHWDVLLPFVIYFGQRRKFFEGFILTFIASHLYSLTSAAPIGVFVVYYLVVFGLARLISYVVYADRWYSIGLLMLALGGVSRPFLGLIAYSFGHDVPISFVDVVMSGMVLNSAVGVFVYWLLSTVDKVTYKVPRMNLELFENSL